MKIVIDIPEVAYEAYKKWHKNKVATVEQSLIATGTPLPKGYERKFEKIVVEYPPEELCTYPEYRGKPYFSIMYEENGEHFIGFGTYKPDVLSSYIREYFIVQTTGKEEE